MMRNKICRLLCAALVACVLVGVPAGCAQNGEEPQPSAGEQTASTTEGTETTPPGGILPGVDAENYPAVDGSTANVPMMVSIYSHICGVSKEEAEQKVTFSGGTGKVWYNMLYGDAELLLVYEAPEEVKEVIETEGIELDSTPIGRDGLVFLVNKQTSVDSLTREQLRDIYTGKITDWSEVGGEAGPIVAYQRNEGSGSQTLFRKLLMGDTEPMQAPSELVPASMGGLIEAVAAFEGEGGSIGFSVYYYANLMYENPNLKLLAVDGIQPSSDTIADGTYPLVNDFYAVIRKSEPENSPARLLRDWLFTDEAAGIIEEAGYVVIP